MGLERLSGLLKSRVVQAEMAGLAAVGFFQLFQPALSNPELKVRTFFGFYSSLFDKEFVKLLLIGQVGRVGVFPDLSDEKKKDNQS